VVALAPVVPDALVPVDDEGIDVQAPEPRRDGQPRLAGADDQHRRIAVKIGLAADALIQPIVAAEVARIGFPARPTRADLLLEALQFLE
jgi:hypothetical protein